MVKSHQNRSAKTPPSKGEKTKTSPRNLKANERKRGSGPFGRGGKMPLAKKSTGGKGRQSRNTLSSSSSSSSESDKDDELDEEDKDDKRHCGGFGIKLLTMLREKDRTIKKLRAEMDYMKKRSKPSKKTIREIMMWSGEEINFSESVNTFIQEFLFPRYKFLKEGWQRYQHNMNNSLSSMCLRRLSLPEGSDSEDIWDRVIIPLIQMKYINIKGNMNNDLKKIYMSVYCVLHNPIAV